MHATSFIEMIFVLFGFAGPFNQIAGMPPAPRDAKLVNAASGDSLFFMEWAGRAEGKAGGEGIDGLVADPEVVHFVQRLISALGTSLQRESKLDELKDLPQFVVDLTSHPGCVFLSLDDGEQEVNNATPNVRMMLALRAALVINLEDDADDLSAKTMKLMSMALRSEIDSLEHVALPAPLPVELHKHGNYLILATGPELMEEVIGRIDAGTGGLAENANFQSAWKDVQLERTGHITFVNIDTTANRVGNLLGATEPIQQYMKIAGIDGAKSTMSVTGVVDGQVVTNSKINGVSGNDGIMALAAGRAITQADFALTPNESDLVLAASINVAQIKQSFIAAMQSIQPGSAEEIEGNLAQIANRLEIDLQSDVFDVLDDVIVVSDSPSDGGWLITNPVLTVGIKDFAAAEKTIQKLNESMIRQLPTQGLTREYNKRGVTFEKSSTLGTEITTFNIIGDAVPFAPSWCLTKTHLMLALNPQAIKSRLRQSADDNWKPFGDTFANQDQGPTKNLSGGEPIAYSHVKTKALLTKLYGFAPMIGQVILSEAQSDGFDMSLADVPSAAAILPYLSNSTSYIARVDGGIRSASHGPPLVGGLSSSIPAIVPFVLFGSRQEIVVNAADVQVVEE